MSRPEWCHNYGQELCDKGEDGCRYWIDFLDTGNCALRITYPFSCSEVGRVMGISKQRVEQLETRVYRKLKVALEDDGVYCVEDLLVEEDVWAIRVYKKR